ncbi:MAG: tRNA (adenine-N1)-methyltransferase [Candidatus Methanomethylicaceae archaeon]|nr:tRNA (adenine-N1)-methyltransferase [Candidatus Verstraetearchaeota archaeon]
MSFVVEGAEVLLYLNDRKSWILKVERGKKFHTHKGIVNFEDLIGKPYGSEIVTSLGIALKILPADYLDHLERIARKTQIIYPKDMAYIALVANVRSGSKVVECGTGSGALTSYLASLVGPDGKVFTYEMREDFQKNAKKNLERLGLEKFVEFKLKDITKGIDEKEVDAVILDMATPWLVVEEARKALKIGGRMVSFSPTINQVEKTVTAMEKAQFINIKAVELIMRGYKVKVNETRPDTLMIGHTGYIVSGRRC